MRQNNSIFEKLHLSPRIEKAIKKVIPLPTRKKIKSYIVKFLVPATEIISPEIKAEWQNHHSEKADIINFGVISWDLRFQRPQQLACKLASAGHRVFYIEHEFLPASFTQSKHPPIQVTKKTDNIYQVTISASRELFIYQDKASETDKKIIIQSIKNLINQANITNPIAKIDHPFWENIAQNLAMPVIYDCMDDHLSFSESGKEIQNQEKSLVNKSDHVIVSSRYLFNQIKQPQKTTLIPNAADYSHFHKKTKTIPSDIKHLPHPLIGYYGALSDWFDASLLKDALEKHPDKSFVLIGKMENPEIEKLNYKNLYVLGEKPYSQLPRYLHQFDLCLIPFKLSPLIKATNPVKIFEYFSAGKPVVSTNLPELKPFANQIYFADEHDFSTQISAALKDTDHSSKQTIARNNTWHHRFLALNKIINSFFPKVSIVILSYNHPDLVKKTLDSVLNRSFYPNMETIVVDNNSDKKTKNLLKKYPAKTNLKIIYNSKNYGFAKGNNIGLKAATGDYLILLNNDVIVTPGWISRLLYHLKQPATALVGPITNSIGNEALVRLKYDSANQSDLENTARKYTSSHWGEKLEVNNIAAFCWMLSRQTYQKVGDLDERFGRGMFEDDDYCKRIKKLGHKIIICDDVFIHHFGGASFKPLPEYQEIFEENKAKFEEKWHQKWVPHQYRK